MKWSSATVLKRIQLETEIIQIQELLPDLDPHCREAIVTHQVNLLHTLSKLMMFAAEDAETWPERRDE